MSAHEHTLGPWVIVGKRGARCVATTDGQEVAAAPSHEPTYLDDSFPYDDNLRLIAAAPDLLAALEDAADLLDRLRSGGGCLARARAAIAKARRGRA